MHKLCLLSPVRRHVGEPACRLGAVAGPKPAPHPVQLRQPLVSAPVRDLHLGRRGPGHRRRRGVGIRRRQAGQRVAQSGAAGDLHQPGEHASSATDQPRTSRGSPQGDFTVGDIGIDGVFVFNRAGPFNPSCSRAWAPSTTTSTATASQQTVGNCNSDGAWSFMAEAGAGVMFRVAEHISLRMDGRYRYDDNSEACAATTASATGSPPPAS